MIGTTQTVKTFNTEYNNIENIEESDIDEDIEESDIDEDIDSDVEGDVIGTTHTVKAETSTQSKNFFEEMEGGEQALFVVLGIVIVGVLIMLFRAGRRRWRNYNKLKKSVSTAPVQQEIPNYDSSNVKKNTN